MPQQPDPGPGQLNLKKYANRRYYDASDSRHLTLAEIRNRVKAGTDLKVTEAATSADITAQVLTQILLEFETPKLEFLPVPLLVHLVRMTELSQPGELQKYFQLPSHPPPPSPQPPPPKPRGKDLDELLGLFD